MVGAVKGRIHHESRASKLGGHTLARLERLPQMWLASLLNNEPWFLAGTWETNLSLWALTLIVM